MSCKQAWCALALLGCLAGPRLAAAAPPIVTVVPLVAADPSIPHRTWSGRVVWMKAVADVQGADYEYTWDFGDGTTNTFPAADRYSITAQHAYVGAVGTVFHATVTVRNLVTAESTTMPYPVEVCDRTAAIEAQVARDDGLWYLHRIMNRSNPSDRPASGTWYGIRVGTEWAYDLAITPAVLTAFQRSGYLATGDPAHPYTETVRRGFQGTWGSLYTVATAAQTNGLGTFDPDVSGNGIAVRGYWDGTHMWANAFFIEALVASGTPDAAVPSHAGIADGIAGRTYAGLVQDMVDYYSYCQFDAAPQGGGWGGTCNLTPYQSTSRFAAIGLLAARGFGGVVVPDIVRQWNETWLAHTQDPITGGFGSSDATGPTTEYTAAGLVQLALDGVGRGSTAWDLAETYMRDRFVDDRIYPPSMTRDFPSLQAFVHALRQHDSNDDGVPEPIVLLQSQTPGVTPVDWYAAHVADAGVTGVVGAVVDAQYAYIGYWTGEGNANSWWPFNTSWAICMLTKLPPVVTAMLPSTGPAGGGTLVTITGRNFEPGSAVEFDSAWGASVVVTGATTIEVRTPAHAAGPVPVRVRNPDYQSGSLPNAFTYVTPRPGMPAHDFDGDAKADPAVYRPASGTWFSLDSAAGNATYTTRGWGVEAMGDVPVRGDFDGDGIIDPAVFRPSTGTWFILESHAGFTTWNWFGWGGAGDTLMPADYDGDGRADAAIFRASTGRWYVRPSSGAPQWNVAFGAATDIPLAGDFDGDGHADIAVYRPGSGTWFWLKSSTGFTEWEYRGWGVEAEGDVPVPGDYDGDGRTDLCVFRPATGTWFILETHAGFATWTWFGWGESTDVLAPADYDADGRTDAAVYRPSTGTWYVRPSGGAATWSVVFGATGDLPLAGIK